MKINFAEIWEGWRNHLVPPARLKEHILQVSEERMIICRDCDLHSSRHYTPLRPDEHCTECGCPLIAKTKCLSCECGIKKWLAVLSEEEEESLNIEEDEKGGRETEKGSSEASDRHVDGGLQ